jgi:HK97 family phage major capsid protein
MATATAELLKLSVTDLTDRLEDAKKKATALGEAGDLDVEQEGELVDLLDEAEALTEILSNKKSEDTKRRLEKLKAFDTPKARKAGNNGSNLQDFSCLGEKLHSIARHKLDNFFDPRLRNALGANETTQSEGGFLVGSDSEIDLMSKVYGQSFLPLVKRTTISSASNALKLKLLKENSRADGSRQGGVQAYWENESDSTTATKRLFEEVELSLKKIMAVSYATSELLEDFPAMESELSDGFQEEMIFKLENAMINGDGVGKPLGILNSPAKVAVTVESGQTASSPLLAENVAKMYARMHPRSVTNAVWLVDQSLFPSLSLLNVAMGTAGALVYMPAGGLSSAPYATIYGRPVYLTEHTKAKNTEGDIIFWDPTSYRVIEKGGVKTASSLHVAFLTDEMAFRWTYRVNGAPKWRSALTPKNGGDTLSTIVTLATRS